MLVNLLKFELNKLFKRKELIVILTVEFVYICIVFIYTALSLYKFPTSELPSAYQIWMYYENVYFAFWGDIYALFLIPLLATIPYADSYLEDRKEKVVNFIISRCDKKLYILNKGIVVFLSGFIVIFIPLLVHQFLCLILLPVYTPSEAANGHPTYYIYFFINMFYFSKIYTINPYLHNLLYMFLNGIFAGAIAVFSYALSFFKKINRYAVIILPTIFYFVMNYIGAVLNTSTNLSIGYYLIITSNVKGLNYRFFAFSVISLIIISIITIYFNYSRDEI